MWKEGICILFLKYLNNIYIYRLLIVLEMNVININSPVWR